MTEQTTSLSASVKKEIDHWLKKFPEDQKRSAMLPALRVTQAANAGWLSEDLVKAVADYLEQPHIAAFEVATFYHMYNLKPVGRHQINVCGSISCKLCDCKGIMQHLEKKLDIKVGETTGDGKFTLKEVGCLAACVNAPMMQVNLDYHENLTPEKVDTILETLE
jgi:NADH-quinone oxidoreductase subunit E